MKSINSGIILLLFLILGIGSFALAVDVQFSGDDGDFAVPSLWVGEVRMVELETLGQGLGITSQTNPSEGNCRWITSDETTVRFDEGSSFVALPNRVIQFRIEVQSIQDHFYAPLLGILDLLTDLGFRMAYRPELDEVRYHHRDPDLATVLNNERDKWAFDVIVVDPGHGGKDPGAIGKKGTREKTIVLQVAKRLKPLLENRLGVKVVMTRDKDVFVTLAERGRIANAAGGKLFLSLHCNAAHSRRARGIETYFLAPARRERALKVALAENSVIQYEETTAEYPDLTDEGYILTAMAQSHFMKESEELASVVQDATSRALNLPNRGVDQAGFYVLIGASMPAILFEMGFISHPKEEMLLRSAQFQQQIAEAICQSVEQFVKRHQGS